MEKLPFDVRCLTEFPQDTWIGKTVLMPMEQANGKPAWRTDEMMFPEDELKEGEEHGLRFDLGVVIEVYPDPDFSDVMQCRYVMGDGHTLHYGAHTLWVPTQITHAPSVKADRHRDLLTPAPEIGQRVKLTPHYSQSPRGFEEVSDIGAQWVFFRSGHSVTREKWPTCVVELRGPPGDARTWKRR